MVPGLVRASRRDCKVFLRSKIRPSFETHRYVLRVVPVLYILKLLKSNYFASHANIENIERNQWLDIIFFFLRSKIRPSFETHRYVVRVVPVIYTLKLLKSNYFASHANIENIERNQRIHNITAR